MCAFHKPQSILKTMSSHSLPYLPSKNLYFFSLCLTLHSIIFSSPYKGGTLGKSLHANALFMQCPFFSSPYREGPLVQPSLQLQYSCGALSSSLPIGEDPWAKVIRYFATLSIYKTLISIHW